MTFLRRRISQVRVAPPEFRLLSRKIDTKKTAEKIGKCFVVVSRHCHQSNPLPRNRQQKSGPRKAVLRGWNKADEGRFGLVKNARRF